MGILWQKKQVGDIQMIKAQTINWDALLPYVGAVVLILIGAAQFPQLLSLNYIFTTIPNCLILRGDCRWCDDCYLAWTH